MDDDRCLQTAKYLCNPFSLYTNRFPDKAESYVKFSQHGQGTLLRAEWRRVELPYRLEHWIGAMQPCLGLVLQCIFFCRVTVSLSKNYKADYWTLFRIVPSGDLPKRLSICSMGKSTWNQHRSYTISGSSRRLPFQSFKRTVGLLTTQNNRRTVASRRWESK